MNLEEAVKVFAHDGILHLAARERAVNIARVLLEPFDPDVHYPIIYIHIHFAMLKEAEILLEGVPDRSDETYKQLEDYHKALETCEDYNAAVFPLSVRYSKWWSGPHLSFPPTYKGRERTSWHPIYINRIEDDGKHLYCHVGKMENGEMVIGEVAFPADKFDDEYHAADFGEVAFYGQDADAEYIIKLHGNGPWKRDAELQRVVDLAFPYIKKSHELLNEQIRKEYYETH